MLPSKGYFNDIECPYLENNCGRPYCHFNHRKKQLENCNEVTIEESCSKAVPTYKPTPKSELAVRKSHIPISYVPDVYTVDKSSSRSFRSNTISDIIYKPTPISLLNSAVNKTASSDDTDSLHVEDNSDSKYTPQCSIRELSKSENREKYEYKPTEHEIEYKYNPSSNQDVNEESMADIVYKPNSSGLISIPNVEYTPSACSKQNSNIDFENLDNEFDMIDEIINMSDVPKKSKILGSCGNKLITLSSNSESENKSYINEPSSEILNDSENCNGDALKQRSSQKKEDLDVKERSKRDKKDRKPDEKSKHKEKKDKHEESKIKRHEKKDKGERCKDNEKYDKRISESSRSRDKEKKSTDKKISEKETKEQSTHSKKESDKNDTKSRHRHTEDKKKDGKTSSNHREHDKSKHSKHKSDKHENGKKYGKSPKKHEEKKKRESSKVHVEFEETKSEETAIKEFPHIPFDFDIDIDVDDQQTMEECFKIFNEYKPSVAQHMKEESVQIKSESSSIDEIGPIKKRIAHSNTSNALPKFEVPKLIHKPTPGQIMNNRFKIVKAAQAENEEKLITKELKEIFKRPQPAQLLKPAKKIKLDEVKPIPQPSNVSLIDEILNKANSKPANKKIAPVSNVMGMQKAKASLKISNNNQGREQFSKTIAQTNKTGKRQAHIPDYSLTDIPDVLDVDKSKLPVNVRTRFLTLLADECCKLYLVQKEAYKRALDEEYSCYQKCKVLVTYRNSAMLAVNRLRKELKEREEKNLGPIGSEESGQDNLKDGEKKIMYNKIEQYMLTNEELDIHGYPRESTIPGRAIIKNRKTSVSIPLPKNQKKCCRCSKIYLIDDGGKAIYEEECLYHPLKKRTIRGEHIYLCCKSSDDSGCVTCHAHVSESPEDAELEGFQTTLPPNGDSDPRSYAVYALDCEMCYTTKGLELTRVTVIDTNCKTVYESLVKPLNEIIDYNTRFSGITKQHMDKTSTGILQVQANILHLCNSKTILIGHSLESDMKALKIIHSTIVDTAVLFPHKMGLPHKRALRTLASDYLKKIIQNDVSGHDSAEDAITCMELIKWKVKEDTKFKN